MTFWWCKMFSHFKDNFRTEDRVLSRTSSSAQFLSLAPPPVSPSHVSQSILSPRITRFLCRDFLTSDLLSLSHTLTTVTHWCVSAQLCCHKVMKLQCPLLAGHCHDKVLSRCCSGRVHLWTHISLIISCGLNTVK